MSQTDPTRDRSEAPDRARPSVEFLVNPPPLCLFSAPYQRGGGVFSLGFDMVLEITSLIDLLMLGIRIAPEAREKMVFCTVLHIKNPSIVHRNCAEGAQKNHFSDNYHNQPKSLTTPFGLSRGGGVFSPRGVFPQGFPLIYSGKVSVAGKSRYNS